MNYKSMIFFLQIKSPAEYMGTVEMSSQILLAGTFNHGLLNRWTDIFILPRTPWGLTFNPNN